MASLRRVLTLLPPLAVVLGVVTIVALAARSPLPPANRLREVGVASSDLRPVLDRVDAEFSSLWKAAGVTPAPEVSELQILRRLSLALHGSIPSLEEIRQFEADTRPDRIDHWIRQMLADKRFADYFAERLARSLVGKEGGQFVIYRRGRFVDWLSEQLQKSTPFDVIVKHMVSGTGLWTGTPEVNFITAAINEGEVDENKLAGKTVRAFLGQRMTAPSVTTTPSNIGSSTNSKDWLHFMGRSSRQSLELKTGQSKKTATRLSTRLKIAVHSKTASCRCRFPFIPSGFPKRERGGNGWQPGSRILRTADSSGPSPIASGASCSGAPISSRSMT
jgi:hypothetical protein